MSFSVFDLFAKIRLDSTEYDKGLNDAEKKGEGAGKKIGEGLVSAGKAAGVAIGAAATAIGVLTKKSVEAYSNYEQLVGGVETLFGAGGRSIEQYAKDEGKTVAQVEKEYNKLMSAQDKVMRNAADAYKTSGLSANEYMETVTSFAASLTSSLGGNTKKAASYADQAIIDMSDNANKMGSSMESIQNAYQGFAKQNYNMLDNLKLGYGGTQQEMFRLMQDAAKLDKTFAKSADFSLDEKGHLTASFADITQAIHIVQNELGITGTTAHEATETIQGSLNMTKSAWDNLVTGFADPEADIGALIENLMQSVFGYVDEGGEYVKGALDNLIPAVQQALEGIGAFMDEAIPQLLQKLPDQLEWILPLLITAATSLVTGLVSALPSIISVLVAQIPSIMTQITNAIIDTAPAFIDAGMQLFTMLGDGVKKAVDYVKANGETILNKVLDTITAKLPTFLDNGVKLITNLANGLFNALPTVISKAGQIMSKLIAFIISNAPTILSKGMELIVNLAQGLLKALPNIISSITQITTGLIRQLIAAIPTIIETGFRLIGQLAAGLIKALPNIIKSAGELIKGMVNVWKSYDWLTVGKNVISGIINGLKSMGSAVVSAMVDIAKSAMNAIKNFFGIKSPSRKMRDEVGKNIVLGMIQGVNDEKKNAKKSAEELAALYVSTAKNKLKALQAQNKLSLEEEWAYWLEVREATKKGSKAYNDATVEIGKVKDKIAKENEKIAKEQEKFKKNIDKTTTTYIDKVKQVTENLDKEVEKLREAYNEAVAKRRDEILGQLGLFDEFKADEAVDKTSLTENLKAQVEALHAWDETLKALEGRIGDTSLYDELQNMGVKSLGTLTNLNSMSDEELQAYMNLYDEKTRIAQDRAEREHEDLKATTDEQINDLITTADKQIKTLEKQYKKDIKELGLNANKAFNSAGKNSIKGMRAGMDSEMDKLETHMMARARELAEAVRAALEIESPSKVFARDVGRWIPLGIEKGFDQAMPEAESGILSGVDDLKESINGALSTSYSVGGTVQGLSITDILYGIYEAIMDANIEQAMTNALDNTHFDINDREFARLVKAV